MDSSHFSSQKACQELQDSLEQGSAFLSDLRGILDNTRPISDAVTVCAATLTNLQSMFESASNLNPTAGGGCIALADSYSIYRYRASIFWVDVLGFLWVLYKGVPSLGAFRGSLGGGASLLHSCELCSALATPIASAVTALESGVGTALAETRGVVEEQLQGENLQQLRDSRWVRKRRRRRNHFPCVFIDLWGFFTGFSTVLHGFSPWLSPRPSRGMMSGSAPLVELKTLVHAAFGPFVKEDTLETVSDQLSSVGTLSSVALIGIALVLAFCSSSEPVGTWGLEGERGGNRGVLRGLAWFWMDLEPETGRFWRLWGSSKRLSEGFGRSSSAARLADGYVLDLHRDEQG